MLMAISKLSSLRVTTFPTWVKGRQYESLHFCLSNQMEVKWSFQVERAACRRHTGKELNMAAETELFGISNHRVGGRTGLRSDSKGKVYAMPAAWHLCVLRCSVMSDSLRPHGLQLSRIPCPWGFSRQEYWSRLPCPPPEDLPKPGIEPRSLALQADSLPTEPHGKPKNIRGGSLSLLQGIFLTQESNWGLLHCRWILYQLSYQGSPCVTFNTSV